MSKYLSARRLGISTAEHRAMVQVVDLIAGVPNGDFGSILESAGDRLETTLGTSRGTLFNMNYAATSSHCGTVACLGGHVALVMLGLDLTEEFPAVTANQRDLAQIYVDSFASGQPRHDEPLARLYYPVVDPTLVDGLDLMLGATAVQASFALRHYLKTGEVDWVRAVAEAPPPPPPGPAYGDPDHPYDPE